MLPQYVALLNKLVPSARNWSQSVIRCVQYLLKTTNHGANQFQINAKLVSGHLPLIDHVLKLLDEPIFYNNLSGTLSNVQMNFVYIAISFLVNMISEPEILAHIKQSQVTRIFLRLTSCEYEPLVFNVYTLLAYTTHEEDIKAMKNPGRFFATIIESLKTALNQKPEKRSQIEQLLETLRGKKFN
jgi:thiamine kinase-like enzyme